MTLQRDESLPEREKYVMAAAVVASLALERASILDAGCRDCVLRTYLPDAVDYERLDLFQNSDGTVKHVMSLEDPLPFGGDSYDVVAALDVVEHLDDFLGGLSELLRVARRKLIVVLPNMSHLLFRLRFLRRGFLGPKYDLSYGAGADGHTWLTVQPQSDAFMQTFAQEHGLELVTHWMDGGTQKKAALYRWGKRLGLPPSLWSWASLYEFTKGNRDGE